jgi:hypothetical protein
VERRRDDVVEREIRLEVRLIEVVARLAQLLGVVTPIPGSEPEVPALVMDDRLERVALGERTRPRRRPHGVEQPARRVPTPGHGVGEHVIGEARIAEQARLLGAQRDHLGDQTVVVVGAAVAARDPGGEQLLTQVAPSGELQERLDVRTSKGDGVAAGIPAPFGGALRRRAHELRQAREIIRRERQGVALLVGQHVLAEGRPEGGKALHDLGEPPLAAFIEAGAGAAERDVIALQHALLLRRKSEIGAAGVKLVDAVEEAGVGEDGVAVRGEKRRDFAFDRHDGRVSVGAGEEREDIVDPRQRPPAALHCRNRVVEARRRRIGRDARERRALLRHGAHEGGAEVLRRNAPERRHLVGAEPGGEQRIVRHRNGAAGFVGKSRRRLIEVGSAGASGFMT